LKWAAILAGGSGTRFWPLSTPTNPKQFLPLATDVPLLVEAVRRLDPLIPPERVLIITGQRLAQRTGELLTEIPPENVLAEPQAAQTTPALAWATHEIHKRDPEATIVSLHADWVVGDDQKFRDTVAQALSTAEEHDVLVTVGIVPTRPEIGYGYIQPGEPLDESARKVDRFLEKPDEDRARELIEEGALWNSGLFAWTAERFFAETRSHAPEVAPHLSLLDEGNVEGFFQTVTPIVIDISHFERSDRVAVVPGTFPWDDVGTWTALSRIRGTDDSGNCLVGDVASIDSTDCVVWTDGEPIVISGLENAVVVRSNGATLVTTRERALNLKNILDQLPKKILDRP
jgi:mannose-1-phosphate guanylyltransferase